jgi:hypothetical protein
LESQLIAYDAAAPERVSVSFGTLDVLDTTTTIRSIRLANKSASPISVTVAYTGVSNMPGVTFDVGAGKIITVPAFGFATTTVRVTADATAMARHADPARQTIPPDAFPWVDEASGYVSFVPNAGSQPTIHLPIFALPRVVSALSAQSGPIDLSNTITLTVPIAITGNAPAGIAPTQTVPLMGVFGLAHSSPPITQVPTGDPMINRYAQGDLRYVGVAGPMMVNGERMLYFALVAYGEWSTPLEVTYQIAMDVNNDYLIDYTLQNSEAIGISVLDFAISDNFVSLLGPAGRNRIVQGTLNLYAPTEYDTRPFGSNIMILPLRLDDLGPGVDRILYQVTSTHRDISEADSGEVIEVTPILSLPLNGNAAIRTGQTLPLFPILAGDTVPALFERAAYNNQRLKGMLLLFLHNDLGTRSQVVPIDYDTFSNYLPIIDAQ